jgi:regulator of replication initiation timing
LNEKGISDEIALQYLDNIHTLEGDKEALVKENDQLQVTNDLLREALDYALDHLLAVRRTIRPKRASYDMERAMIKEYTDD